MAIDPKCVKCGDELNDNGGIVLSPPIITPGIPKEDWPVNKFHVCNKCYAWVYKYIFNIGSYHAYGKPCPFCGINLDDEVDVDTRSYYPVCNNENCIQKKWEKRATCPKN